MPRIHSARAAGCRGLSGAHGHLLLTAKMPPAAGQFDYLARNGMREISHGRVFTMNAHVAAARAERPVHIGEHLREWRQRRHLSQLDLAGEAEISARHLSFVETGRSAPSREMVLETGGATGRALARTQRAPRRRRFCAGLPATRPRRSRAEIGARGDQSRAEGA